MATGLSQLRVQRWQNVTTSLGGLSEANGKAPKQDERSMLYKVLKTINIVIVWMAIVSISVVFNIVDMH